MESYVKIKSSLKEMTEKFDNSNSSYYYIKYYDGEDNYKGNDSEEIVFNCLIRHNEIGNQSIEKNKAYTFRTLEATLEEKCRKYEELKNDNAIEM